LLWITFVRKRIRIREVPARPGNKPAKDHRPRREVYYRSLGVWEFNPRAPGA
jgi:hypothetical protein